MSFDMSPLLDSWEFNAGQVMVRQFRTKDGTEKVQMRVDLGILQMNAHGRPDGKRPNGHESLLDYYKNKGGPDLKLDAEACARVHQEIVQYHHRYICLYQLGDYNAVIRDTNRNEEAIRLVQEHAVAEEFSLPLQQFKPQLMMMRIRARGAIALVQKDFDQAIAIIEAGIEEIREFALQSGRVETCEPAAEIRSLEAWLEEVRSKRPLTQREKLERALSQAVEQENYEQAAKVRDAIRKLKAT